MKQKLLIIGAGIYGLVAKEIAESMGCFERIAFADDHAEQSTDGTPVIGTTWDLPALSNEYTHVVVAIGNPEVRQKLLNRIAEETRLQVANLISPCAYVSPSAQLGKGCIIEPMAVVHANCVLGSGCFICAGAVVNHASICGECVQVDCNATVAGRTVIARGAKIPAGTVFQNIKHHGPIPFDDQEYSFEDGM